MARYMTQNWERHVLLVITGVKKIFTQNTVHNVICNDLIDTYTKRRTENFDEELDKRFDNTTLVDDVGSDFYIDDVD